MIHDSLGEQITYKDLPFRIIISLLAAHFIISFGVDIPFFEFLLLKDYYLSMAGSFIIAFLLISIIRFVTQKLDLYYDWNREPVKRSAMQVALGLAVPSIVAFLLATFYFRIHNINVLDTVYLKYDFPVIVLFLLLCNLYYLAFYFYKKTGHVEKRLAVVDIAQEEFKSVLILNKGTANIPVNTNDVAYFFHEGNYNFVRLFEGEDFMLTQPLDDLYAKLDPGQFYRANRQIIVSFRACQHFELLEYGKLELSVKPPFSDKIIISQKRAKDFKSWMEH